MRPSLFKFDDQVSRLHTLVTRSHRGTSTHLTRPEPSETHLVRKKQPCPTFHQRYPARPWHLPSRYHPTTRRTMSQLQRHQAPNLPPLKGPTLKKDHKPSHRRSQTIQRAMERERTARAVPPPATAHTVNTCNEPATASAIPKRRPRSREA